VNIHKLLSTKERVKILRLILYRTNPLRVNEVARESELSKGLISKFFDVLLEEGILEKIDAKFSVQDNPNTSAIKILLNIECFDTALFNKFTFVSGAGLYGSFVKGKNTEESDIDAWVLIDKTDEENLARLTSELKRRYENIKPLYLTREKIEILKREDPLFYHSLVFGSINVYGEGIEI